VGLSIRYTIGSPFGTATQALIAVSARLDVDEFVNHKSLLFNCHSEQRESRFFKKMVIVTTFRPTRNMFFPNF